MSDSQPLRDSFALVGKSGDEVPRYFYSYLVLIAPEVRPMFPVAMGMQRDRLVADPIAASVVAWVTAQEARSLSRSSESVPGSAEYTVRARARSRWAETSIVR